MTSRTITVLMVTIAVTAFVNPALAAKKKSAVQAYAMATVTAPNSRTVIGWDGRTLGADPDQNIRFQLMRDGFANEN
jgi:hypothetical protein